MGNISYILKRIKTLNWGQMWEKIDTICQKTGKSKLTILLDMQKCAILYGAGYMDYDLFEMYNLTSVQRDTYLTRGRNNKLVVKYCDKAYFSYFTDKSKFNERLKKYLKRDWIKIDDGNKESVIEFIKKHSVFMAKPIYGECGHGIEKICTSDFTSADAVYEYVTKEGTKFELEEVIQQHPSVAKIYPDSINTVRVVTIVTTEDKKSYLSIPQEKRQAIKLVPHVICTYFRIGNGKYVDNFNSGGMVAPVDEDEGIVKAIAVDKQKNGYERHPMTDQIIKDFQFPDWKEAIDMCKEAALEIPEMGYVGWDVCFTINGPAFVEGNEFPGHDVYQLPIHTPDKIGIMPKFKNVE